MRIGIISGVLGLTVVLPAHAQKSDSIKSLLLPDVVVTESYQQRQAKKSALAVDVVDQDFLRKHFTGNFMQAMENIPGVQAMDIGSGFSKPMIRGMGFNRIAVLGRRKRRRPHRDNRRPPSLRTGARRSRRRCPNSRTGARPSVRRSPPLRNSRRRPP